MGLLIDVQSAQDYILHPAKDSINVYADTLLFNHNKLLNKKKPYYIICNKGFLSKKVVSILEYYGYNVTLVLKDD